MQKYLKLDNFTLKMAENTKSSENTALQNTELQSLKYSKTPGLDQEEAPPSPNKLLYTQNNDFKEQETRFSDGLESSEEEEFDERSLAHLFPTLHKLIDEESGGIRYNRLWNVPGHLGNMIVLGKGKNIEFRELNEDGLEPRKWMIGPDCKFL